MTATVKLFALAVVGCVVAMTLTAQSEPPKPPFKRIWHRSTANVRVSFDGVVPHEPAFAGEDRMRARLQLLNKTNEPIFLKAFDLGPSENDSALLHDVFEGGPCRQARNSKERDDNPVGALSIGYSRLHTSTIVEIEPGKSLQFSVPLDHLSRERCVRVRYWLGGASAPATEDGYSFLWLGPSR